jgi:HD-like signal output (HDOD) protein
VLRAITGQELLPTQAAAAVNVLRLVEDPDTDIADLAAAIGTDPVLAARVIRLASSSYYGLPGRVSTLPFAVSIIGFQSIRGLAVAAAAGLEGPDAVPEGFWLSAATAAAAADLVAPIVNAHTGDAFCLGLLHTLGTALLHQRHPAAQLCLPVPADDATQCQDEVEIYGIDHAHAAAQVLAEWKFPTHLCELIASHHDPTLPDAPPLGRVLPIARTLTTIALHPNRTTDPSNVPAGSERDLARLTDGRLDAFQINTLLAHVRERADALHTALT